MTPESEHSLEASAAAPVDSPSARPAKLQERILDLDILRGMALFGILAANMRGFSAPMDVYFDIGKFFHGRADQIAQFVVDVFIQRKFVTLFSFMFGLGFAAQMARNEARGVRFLGFYPRRLAALAVFGLIHGMAIWAGDILLTYALAGTMLLLLRNQNQKFLLRFITIFLAATTLIATVFSVLRVLGLRKPPVPEAMDMAQVARAVQVYAHGSVAEFFRQNWHEWVHELQGLRFAPGALLLFAMGLWVYRAGIVEHLDQHKAMLKRVCAIALPIGFVLNLLFTYLIAKYPTVPRPVFPAWVVNVLSIWAGPVMSLGYASGLAVLLQNPTWRNRLTPFAAVGRTALTNYLAQSVLCVLFFRLTHLYGVWGPAWDIVPTIVLFSLQIIISNWWLKHFRFGPMEWVWRGLTYGSWPEMRRVIP